MGGLKKNEKYMAVVLRFLKEARLLPLWKEYVNKEIKEKSRFFKYHWSDEKYIDYILGRTSFTSFVLKKLSEKNSGKRYRERTCIYLMFSHWFDKIGKKHYEGNFPLNDVTKSFLTNKTPSDIKINPITEKIKITFEEL